jgi:alkyl hydroperoxide reductase subunit AhpF
MYGHGEETDLRRRLAALPSPVRLVFFTQTFGCETCLPARQAADRIAALTERITVEEHNLVLDREQVAEYGVEWAPGLAVVGAQDAGMRYYGIPDGYEIESLVDAIEIAGGGGGPTLRDETLDALDALDRDVHLRVFVTPT